MTKFSVKMLSLGVVFLFACSTAVADTGPSNSTNGQMQAASWLSAEAKTVTPAELTLLRRAQQTLLGNVVFSNAWKPYPGIVPSLGTYHGIWNWDAAFHAVAVSHWNAALAKDQIDILFSRQLPDGRLPDVIFETGKAATTITKPPVMAWAVAVVDHRSPDIAFLRKMYPKLVRLGDYWFNEHGGRTDGLYYYTGTDVGAESGWDNSIRWDDGYRYSKSNNHRLWAIDLNCYMVMHYDAMAYIAGRLHMPQAKAHWLEQAQLLAKRINAKLWNNKLGFYVDRDRITGEPGPALSPAGFMPLFIHIATPERAARVAKLAASPQYFFPGMPTAAYNTPGYESQGYWRGSTWLNTSYFALKGLQEYGYISLAAKMRQNLLGWVARGSTIREYYDSKTGAGAGAKGFGWSAAFTIAFITDWDNNLTWLFQQ